MGINYFYGHFEGGNKGYFMPWDKNKKHQKLIYFTELRLKTKKKFIFMRNFRLNLNIKCNDILYLRF
jgi:hypothetical protein